MIMRQRNTTEINASSMADIAFLLLVFFLVTTTMKPDTGIIVKLPPWVDEPIATNINERNVLSVLINANNDLLVRGELVDVNDLRERAKEFMDNPMKKSYLSASPQKAIISLQNDRGTRYGSYLMVYSELRAANSELRNEESLRLYGQEFTDALTKEQKKEVRAAYPFIISEAEPTAYLE